MRIVECNGRRAASEVPTLKAFPDTPSRRGVESLNLDIFRIIASWCYVIVCLFPGANMEYATHFLLR